MVEIEHLVKIVGEKNFFNSADILYKYSKDMSFVPRIQPKCVVAPNQIEELKEIVSWANKNKTPLVPISSGAPHFRGDTVPSTGGAVIVKLDKIKKIRSIDNRNRIAMIEPGVTFDELIPLLANEGLRLNMPLLPRGSKSIIGSILEREPVIIPLFQWDAIDPLTCIEGIFGTGDVFRTGSAAGPGTLEEQKKAKQAQVSQPGPGQLDLARVVQGAQGTMGIVTWATIRCELSPILQKPFFIGAEKFEELSEFIYKLMHLKLGEECLVLNKCDAAAILSNNFKDFTRLKEILPQWILFFSLSAYYYYPEEKIAYQEKEMLEVANHMLLRPKNAIAGISANDFLKILEKPSEERYWKIRHKEAFQDVFFLTTLNRVSLFIKEMSLIAGKLNYPMSDMGIYIQPLVQGTSCHCEFTFFYNPDNVKEVSRVRELDQQANESMLKMGAFFSRPYGSIAEKVFRMDSENTAALRKVKQIFDPENILNAGKLCF